MAGEQENPGQPPKSPVSVPLLVIVRRGATERFALLERELAEDTVRIVWDRRVRDRRRGGAPRDERRQGERRSGPPSSWSTLDFTIVRES
jgi:hypothetical protein